MVSGARPSRSGASKAAAVAQDGVINGFAERGADGAVSDRSAQATENGVVAVVVAAMAMPTSAPVTPDSAPEMPPAAPTTVPMLAPAFLPVSRVAMRRD